MATQIKKKKKKKKNQNLLLLEEDSVLGYPETVSIKEILMHPFLNQKNRSLEEIIKEE